MARELQRMQSRHRRIAELFLRGVTITGIAEELDLRPNSVSRIVQSSLFQDLIAKRRREIQLESDEETKRVTQTLREKILAAGEGAVGTLSDLLGSENEHIQLKSASELLNQAFKLPTGEEGVQSGVRVSSVNIEQLHLALTEANTPLKLEAEVIEAESKDEVDASKEGVSV